MGQWHYSLVTDRLSTTLEIAKRVYALVEEQNNSALLLGGHRALAETFYFLGNFEAARQYAARGVQVWRSGGVQSPPEDMDTPVVGCLCYLMLSEWHLGEIASCRANIAEAISLANELNDMNALALALAWAAVLAYLERDAAEVDRLASDLIELSTRYNFAFWPPGANVLRGWARSTSGDKVQGISWIEQGLADYRATGLIAGMPMWLALKAEALYLADRTSEALEPISEAEALVERFEERRWYAELHRLRGVFLAAMGADETQIETSFGEAIRIAKQQKSVSLEKRAKATYAEYRRQKASGSGGPGFRLPLW
jgi:adenylate cyclase